jgi:response regulator RpfG family c-di-GMP phosphodiesterase
LKLKRSQKKERTSDEVKKEVKADHATLDLRDSIKKQSPAVDLDKHSWRALLVDDEPDVHEITRIALKGFTFDGQKLELVSAYSAKQAKKILQQDQKFSAAIIDVVMETETAGLDLVRFIREEMGLSHIRLVVRTGQPGKAPEQAVIKNFDIDDYKEKTDLTSLKMYTMFRSVIKSYRDILTIDRSRIELDKKVQERTKELYETNQKLEATIFDLQKALKSVKQLSGLLPICSHCKKIRDDKGYWNQLEAFIQEHSEAEFSHSICQECAKKYYPDMDLYDD